MLELLIKLIHLLTHAGIKLKFKIVSVENPLIVFFNIYNFCLTQIIIVFMVYL